MRSIWCCDENLGRSLSVQVRSRCIRSFIISNLFTLRVSCGFITRSLVVDGLGYRFWWSLSIFKFFLSWQLFLPLLLLPPREHAVSPLFVRNLRNAEAWEEDSHLPVTAGSWSSTAVGWPFRLSCGRRSYPGPCPPCFSVVWSLNLVRVSLQLYACSYL